MLRTLCLPALLLWTQACAQAESAPEPVAPVAIEAKDTPSFGPILGTTVIVSVPVPGTYIGAFDFEQKKYPTREIYESTDVRGHAKITLRPDKTASACFGFRKKEFGSISKYASHDDMHHESKTDDRQLVGFTGRWSVGKAGIQVSLDMFRPGTCTPDPVKDKRDDAFELRCVHLDKTNRLPVPALACKAKEPAYWIDPIALDLGDNPRAGPWVLRRDPSHRTLGPDPKGAEGPWLLLGKAPGLTIESRDKRDDASPRVTFSAGKVVFKPKDYIKKPKGAARP